MLFKVKPVVIARNLTGFSLIESLLALTLGSILLFGAARFYSYISLEQQRHHEQMRLQQNAHQILDYLRQALLNAGYQGLERSDSNFALFQDGRKPYIVEANCLIVLQDLNSDGCLGTRTGKQCVNNGNSIARTVGREVFALKAEQQWFVLGKYESFSPCQRAECRRLLNGCGHIQWDKLSTIPDNHIEAFEVRWLKTDLLLEIRLVLSSLKLPAVRYEAAAQTYLLNGKAP